MSHCNRTIGLQSEIYVIDYRGFRIRTCRCSFFRARFQTHILQAINYTFCITIIKFNVQRCVHLRVANRRDGEYNRAIGYSVMPCDRHVIILKGLIAFCVAIAITPHIIATETHQRFPFSC